jgi:trans-aconitate methyltransferase
MSSSKSQWDAELYEAKHAFVWKFGQDLIKLLDPKPGERILDLGCGTGPLTRQIAHSGAEVIGLDASPEMIGQARQNYPELQFVLADAANMGFSGEFDAVFSNAALHWMLDASAVALAVSRSLKPSGRFVAEMGGHGNIARIMRAITAVLLEQGIDVESLRRTFFPTVAEYSTVLESAGLEVTLAVLFERPTALAGEHGMRDFLKQVAWDYFEGMTDRAREWALNAVVDKLRSELLVNGTWQADYRRLRIISQRVSGLQSLPAG